MIGDVPKNTIKELRVHQASVLDRQRIWAFIREAYGDETDLKIPERWIWEYLNNPNVPNVRERLPILIAEIGGRIVAQIAAMPIRLKIGDAACFAAWAVDLIVVQSYRRGGIGVELYRQLVESFKIVMAISMARISRRIFQRIGCVTIRSVPVYVRFSSVCSETVYRYFKSRAMRLGLLGRSSLVVMRILKLHYVAAYLLSALTFVRDLVDIRLRKYGMSSIAEVDSFDAEIDTLWESTKNDYPMIVVRDRDYLNWRFDGYNQLHYRKFVARRNRKVVGYAVLREANPAELNLAAICDLYSARSDGQTIQDLVLFSIRFFSRRSAGVKCAFTIAAYRKVLHKFGFHRVHTEWPILSCIDAATEDAVERNRRKFFVSLSDSDWDQIRRVD